MAIAPTLLEASGSATDATSYTTGSVTTTGPTLLGVAFARDETGGPEPALPSAVTSTGLTWTHVHDEYFKNTGTTVREKIALYKGIGAGGTGVITISFAGSGYTCIGIDWAIIKLAGADTTDPIVGGQIAGANGTTNNGDAMSATLPSGTPNDAGDRCFAFAAGQNASNATYTEGTNWTELAQRSSGTPSLVIQSEWRSDAFDATGSVTNTSGANFRTGIIVVEVAIQPTGGGGGPGSHVMLALTGVG